MVPRGRALSAVTVSMVAVALLEQKQWSHAKCLGSSESHKWAAAPEVLPTASRVLSMLTGVSSIGVRMAREPPTRTTKPLGSGRGVPSPSHRLEEQEDFVSSDRARGPAFTPKPLGGFIHHLNLSTAPLCEVTRAFLRGWASAHPTSLGGLPDTQMLSEARSS